MKEENRKIQGLLNASQAKQQAALAKVEITLQLMKEKKIPINFNSVALSAGVSKTWLYKQKELSKEIDALRNKSGKIERLIDLQSILKNRNSEIAELKIKNQNLNKTINELQIQLETVYGELYKLKNRQR